VNPPSLTVAGGLGMIDARPPSATRSMSEPGDSHRRQELADFLKSRRTRVAPESVGLEVGRRRRTPGLRREEVAQLAGISVTWYTWLEQGRPVRASEQVVDCLARVLQLSDAEREHFLALARSEATHTRRVSSPGLVALVESMPFPAYVRDHASYMLGWNGASEAMFGDFATEPGEPPNLLSYLFLSARARKVFADWEEVAAGSVAQFRRHSAVDDDGEISRLVSRLRDRSQDFVEMWDRFVVQESYVGERTLNHPRAGTLTFNYATLSSYDGGPPWVTLYTPASEQSQLIYAPQGQAALRTA
jgi:transcriptional regulator with XRE-family HTH domain